VYKVCNRKYICIYYYIYNYLIEKAFYLIRFLSMKVTMFLIPVIVTVVI